MLSVNPVYLHGVCDASLVINLPMHVSSPFDDPEGGLSFASRNNWPAGVDGTHPVHKVGGLVFHAQLLGSNAH